MLQFSGISRRVFRIKTGVSEERITFIFRAEYQPSQKPAYSKCLARLIFGHEDVGDTCLRNVGSHMNSTVL